MIGTIKFVRTRGINYLFKNVFNGSLKILKSSFLINFEIIRYLLILITGKNVGGNIIFFMSTQASD